MSCFAERFALLRKQAGLSQIEIAKRLRVSSGTIGNYESGLRVPRSEKLSEIADFFNVEVDYLLGHTDEKPEFSLEERWIIDLYRLAVDYDKSAVKNILWKYDAQLQLKKAELSSSQQVG